MQIPELPKPNRDPDLWSRVLAKGFELYPARKENYDKWINSKGGATLDYLPTQLDIEVTSRCNFRCSMCMLVDFPKYQRAPDLTYDDYRRIIDSQVGLIEVKLQGIGEPTLHKQFSDMVQYAREKEIWVRTTTNASRLHVKDIGQRLIESGVCELQVSIDGASKESFEKIREGGRWEKVSQNCKELNNFASRLPGVKRTRMWSVIQKDNMHEIEKFPEVAHQLGFERLTLSLELANWGQEKWQEINGQNNCADLVDPELLHRLIDRGAKNGVEITYWYIGKKYDSGAYETVCPWPFGRAMISSDMRVVPCCMISNPDFMELGDAGDFSATWNAAPMQKFREAHLSGDIPKICANCYRSN